jgi:hypothetical protein
VRGCPTPHEAEPPTARLSAPDVPDADAALRLLISSVHRLNVRFQAAATQEMFRKEIAIINDRLAQLEEGAPLRVPIQSLAPEPFEIIKPMEAVVRFLDDQYVASFFDANLSTGGDTQTEAIANLRELIVGTFELLTETRDVDLGPGPRRQKAVLAEFVRRR